MKYAKLIISFFIVLLSYSLLRDVTDVFVVGRADDFAEVIIRGTAAALPISLLLVLVMWILGKNGRVERPVRFFFFLNALLMGLASLAVFTSASCASETWFLMGLCAWKSVMPLISITLVWGYTNQLFTFRSAALPYAVGGIILGLMNALIGEIMGPVMKASSDPTLFFGASCALIALASLAVPFLLTGRLRRKEESGESTTSSGKWWIAGIVFTVIAFKLFRMIPNLPFKVYLKQLVPSFMDYADAMVYMSSFKVILTLLFGMLLVIPAYFLSQKGSRWFSRVTLGVVAFLLLGLGVFGLGLQSQDSVSIWTGYLVASSLAFAFNPFLQLLFLPIDPAKRFRYQLLIMIPLVQVIGVIHTGLVALTGPGSQMYSTVGISLAAVTALVGIYLLRKPRLEAQTV